MKWQILLLVAGISFQGCTKKDDKPEVRVCHASSLTAVLADSKELFANEKFRVQFIPGASSTLVHQTILEHTACDMVISAHEKWINELKKNNLVEKRVDLPFVNSLVFIGSVKKTKNKELKLAELPQTIGRVAFAAEDVPLAIYAQQAMETRGLWSKEIMPRLVRGPDASGTLKLVEIRIGHYGIVYKTDALRSKRVKILEEIPEIEVPYQAAIISQTYKQVWSNKILKTLSSTDAKALFAKHGFKVIVN